MSDPRGALQQVLDVSFEQATTFTRSLFTEDRWDADRVASFINQQRNITICAVTPKGAPHAAVVIAACLDHEVYFTVHPQSLLSRCLSHDPRIAYSVCDVSNAVMGKGTSVKVTRSLDDPALLERLGAVTSVGAFTPAGWDGLICRIDIDRVFAS